MVYSLSSGSDAERLDAVFGALAQRSRRELLEQLAASPEPIRMTDAAARLGLSPQLLNKHVVALERAGLAHRVSRGRERRLVIDPAALADAQQWIVSTRAFWETQFDALADYIEKLERPADD